MERSKIRKIISTMSLEQKAGLCSGKDFWHTKSIKELGIPEIMVSDGPHGLRKQETGGEEEGNHDGKTAVCFPTGCARAASFDRELERKFGEVLGNECRAENVAIILGPAINIKRSPLCGRTFEYYSEDPLLSAEMASSYIDGVQSRNVGACVKHFFGNNQETRRLTISANMDERTEREIYLTPFEGAVKKSKPWSVMTCYNRVNGQHVGMSKKYINDILRDEWGFDGFVMSDWGAVNKRAEDLEAGLDLEMPSSHGANDKMIVEAVNSGKISEEAVDRACEKILNIVYRHEETKKTSASYSLERDHEFASTMAENCGILLKNDRNILPLTDEMNVAVIGQFAVKPRLQGGGSSHIQTYRESDFISHSKKEGKTFMYVDGFSLESDEIDQELENEALKTAIYADAVIVFAGLPEYYESEGFDRKHMRMPKNQNHLIDALCRVQKNVIVVLHHGGPVEMPWAGKVTAILDMYLSGEGVGAATFNLLYGNVNPSGRLPETIPYHLEHNPSYINFPGDGYDVNYKEGVFVGYRYYEKKNIPVRYPFGYGLSYTTFEYSNLKVSGNDIKDDEELVVTVDVTNTGNIPGREVVQIYVEALDSQIPRPVRELRAFDKVRLAPQETANMEFVLNKRAFAYWDSEVHGWQVDEGIYKIQVGRSSIEIVLEEKVKVTPATKKLPTFTPETTVGEVLSFEGTEEILKEITVGNCLNDVYDKDNDANASDIAMFNDLPLRALLSFTKRDDIDFHTIERAVERLNDIVGKHR